jgi:hypothetical protein
MNAEDIIAIGVNDGRPWMEHQDCNNDNPQYALIHSTVESMWNAPETTFAGGFDGGFTQADAGYSAGYSGNGHSGSGGYDVGYSGGGGYDGGYSGGGGYDGGYSGGGDCGGGCD